MPGQSEQTRHPYKPYGKLTRSCNFCFPRIGYGASPRVPPRFLLIAIRAWFTPPPASSRN